MLNITSCSRHDLAYWDNQRKDNFNRNFESFQKLEQMQREDLNVFSISTNRLMSFKEADGLKEAIANGYSYKQNNIDRHKNVETHKFHYKFQENTGLTNERWDEYKKLLERADLRQLVYEYDRPDKRQVFFYHGTDNDLGYLYSEFPPPVYFNNISECKPIMPSQSCFILLRKNWYIFYEKFRLEQD